MTISRNLSLIADNIDSSGLLSLTTGVTSTLPVANGGTGNVNGTVATLTTARAIYGNNFDGSAALTQIIASTYGGTGNGFTKFSGPATAEKTFTLPNATATILTDNAAVTVAQGGTGATSATAYAVQCGGTTSTGAYQSVASVGTAGQVLTSNGAGALPTFQAASGFASGTKMLFAQTSAPTGWTKDTTNYNNHALRVVTGSVSSGGTVDFTTAFASQAVAGSNANTTATNNSYTPAGSTSISGTTGSTTLGTGEIPSHTHLSGTWRIWDASSGVYGQTGQSPISNPLGRQVGNAPAIRNYSESIGSSGGHTHSFSGSGSLSGTAATITQAAHTHTFTGTAINLAVKYLDVILATKD